MKTPIARFCPLVCLVAAGLTGCSGSFSLGGFDYSGRAQELIEDELQDEIGLGDLDVECQEFDDDAVGNTSSCTATTTDGEVVRFETTIEPDNFVDVQTTNFLNADFVARLETDALALLFTDPTERQGITLECGDTGLIVENLELICDIYDEPAVIYDASVTFNDNTFSDYNIMIAEQPRG